MSGIFKNFEKIVSAANFNKANHRFLVRSPLLRFSPAQLYVDPSQKLSRHSGSSFFELSQVVYQLARDNTRHQHWLDSVQENTDAQAELQTRVEQYQEQINQGLGIIALQLQSGVASDSPIESLTSYIYVLSQINSSQGQEIFNDYLKSQILQKIQYASYQNLSDLAQGLSGLGINDEQVWKATLDGLKQKSQRQFETVSYHAWELDQYEYNDKQSKQYVGATEQYYTELAEGKASGIGGYRRTLVSLIEQAYLRFINPIFFRETRQTFIPYTLDSSSSNENLVKALKSVSGQFPEADQVASQVGRQ